MNETLKALIQAGGAIAALGFVWLIVKALVPLFQRKNGHNSDDKFIEAFHEEGRLLRHELRNIAQLIINAWERR